MKSQISMNKGTKSIQLEVSPSNWTGEIFKKHQEETMAALPNSTMSMNKGTASTYSSVYPKPRHTLMPARIRISSGRGTITYNL